MKTKKLYIVDIRGELMNRFSLEFTDRSLERNFTKDFNESTIRQNRFSIIIGSLVFNIFFFLDLFLVPELFMKFFYTRLFTVVPISIIAFISTYSVHQKFSNYIIAFTLLTVGALIDYFIMTTNYISLSPYNFTLSLFFIFSFVVCRVYFLQALTISSIVLLFYETTLFTYGSTNTTEILISNIFVLSGFIIAIISGYYSELLMRKNFLIKTELESANAQINESRLSLEEEVNKRTLELVKANKLLRKSKLRAEGSENLKTNFIANISHEIRTPLTRIIGFSELLTKADVSFEKRKKYSNIVQENSDQLLRIITDMIELSKLQTDSITIEKSPFLLSHFLDSFSNTFIEYQAKYSKTQLRFNIDNFIPDDKFLINSDRNELRRVLNNLLDNAVKFTTKGFVKLSCNKYSENELIICVADTGIGIDKDNLDFIFDHFRQVDDGATRNFGGVGVGLSLCKEIVRNLGGEIWVESERRKGSSFYFKLPYK